MRHIRHMKLMKLMKLILLFVLFVFLMSLFTSTFVSALQESDDNSDESTTVSSRQRRGRCSFIKDSLVNGWVRMRNRGRTAKFSCKNGYDLVGSRISTCIQSKWNNPPPVCATRGCERGQFSEAYFIEEKWRGAVLDMSCQPGFSLPEQLSHFRIYCNGSHWKLFGTVEDYSRYQCKSTESHLITSKEISTISPLNSAVTAKSETTTNSKFNSKMPEMTAMFVSSVININAMSTESTSLSADNSKTPITEPLDKSYSSTNATNIIQEVSTLTTTTTFRSSTHQTQNYETIKTDFSSNHINYSTKLPQLNDNLTQNSHFRTLSSSISTSLPQTTSTSIPLISQTDTHNSTHIAFKPTTDSPRSISHSLITTTITSLIPTITSVSSKQSTPSSVTKWLNEIPRESALSSKATQITNKMQMTTNETPSTSPSIGYMFENSTKLNTESKINITSVPLIRVSTNTGIEESISWRTTRTTTRTTTSSITFKKISQTIPEISIKRALKSQNESSVKISDTNINTTPKERHNMVSTTRQSFSSSSMNSTKYVLFIENTTITPMRRRRQFSTKTTLVVTSVAFDKTNTKKSQIILGTAISMVILVTIVSLLYLIKKRKNTQQNRLSDDSEMRYLSSSEDF